MGLFTGELLHMGIGDVTVSDVEVVGKLVSAVAQPKHYQNGFQTSAAPHQTRAASHANAVFSAPFAPPVPQASAETQEQDTGETPADTPGEQQEPGVAKVSQQKTLSTRAGSTISHALSTPAKHQGVFAPDASWHRLLRGSSSVT